MCGRVSADIVQMHIETLDAVHRESKRLPPIQKVNNSCFYLPLEKGHADPQPAPPTPLSTNPFSSGLPCHSRYGWRAVVPSMPQWGRLILSAFMLKGSCM